MDLDRHQTRELLDYFNAALRQKCGKGGNGHGRFDEDGNYTVDLSVEYPIGEKTILSTWSVVQTAEGSLRSISARPYDTTTDASHEFDSDANSFLFKVMQNTLAGHKKSFFVRNCYVYIGPTLSGEYWLRGTRVAPTIPDDDPPMLVNAERYCCIEQNVSAIDLDHAQLVGRSRSSRLRDILSYLLGIGLYSCPSELRWVQFDTADGQHESRRLHLGLNAKFSHSRMPRKGELCHAGLFGGSLLDEFRKAQTLTLPIESRKVLLGLESAAPRIRAAFESATALYRLGLLIMPYSSTAMVAYLVAANDALCQRSGHNGTFSSFVMQYAHLTDTEKSFVDEIYNDVRSAHFHGGALNLDVEPIAMGDISHVDGLRKIGFRSYSSAILHRSLSGWVMDHIVANAR